MGEFGGNFGDAQFSFFLVFFFFFPMKRERYKGGWIGSRKLKVGKKLAFMGIFDTCLGKHSSKESMT